MIAKEALKADVYKVQLQLRFQSIPCMIRKFYPYSNRYIIVLIFNLQDKWHGYLPPGLPETVDASYESYDYFGTNSDLRRYKDATRYR